MSKAFGSVEGWGQSSLGMWKLLTSGFGMQNMGRLLAAGEVSCDKKCPLFGAKACEQKFNADYKGT